jgi:ribonuclease J
MFITIHRGARQIGGNCVEVAAEGRRILLDLGIPLDAEDPKKVELPPTLKLKSASKPLLGVLVSHAHQDHYGLWDRLDADTPVYIGGPSLRMLKAARPFIRAGRLPEKNVTYSDGVPLSVGPFTVTPYLVDHSVYDAHAFLVECDGKRVLYSGDFRTHGRKRGALGRLIRRCPKPVDVLLCEGTTVGRRIEGRVAETEADLEVEAEKVIRETRGIVLVSFSALNVDRFVTFFRASKRTKRLFLADVYSAEVLLAAGNAKLPDPRKGTMGIFLPAKMKSKIVREGNAKVASKYRPHRIFPEQLRDYPQPLMMAFRDSMQKDLERAECLADGTLIYSYWPGYLERGRTDPRDWCKKHGLRFELLHVSGHADPQTLDLLVEGIQPSRLLPIHTEVPEYFLKRYRMAEAWPDGEEHMV